MLFIKLCPCIHIILAKFSSPVINSKPELNSVFQNTIALLNDFPGCIIKVINYPGHDIFGNKLSEPILLSRFYSLPGIKTIFPIEIRTHNHSTRESKGQQYIDSMNSFEFGNSNRKSRCEAPPHRVKNPDMYLQQEDYWQLKHDRLAWLYMNWEQNIWKLQRANTLTMFAVLVTKATLKDLKCHVIGSTCNAWAEGVWMHPHLLNLNQHLFI